MKLFLSTLCFLATSFLVINAYKTAHQEKTWIRHGSYPQKFWTDYYPFINVGFVDEPRTRNLQPVKELTPNPIHYSVGSFWGDKVLVRGTLEYDMQCTRKPCKEKNFLGLPKKYHVIELPIKSSMKLVAP